MFEKIKASAAFQGLKRFLKSFLTFLLKFIHDWSLHFAGMLAYSLLIAIIPMAVATLGIIGMILKSYPKAQTQFINMISGLVSNSTVTQSATNEVVVAATTQLASEGGVIFVLGFIFSILGASRLFATIDKTLTLVYRITQRPFIRRNLVALGMVFVFIVLFSIIIAASTVPPLVTDKMSQGTARTAIHLAGYVLSLAVSFILFELIYWLIPNKKMPLSVTWCGALVAGCLLEIVVITFPAYIQNNINSYTGLVGFALIFIALLYYFALILILGAQINAYCFEDLLPFKEGITKSLSRVYHEENDGDPKQPLIEKDPDGIPLQQQ